MSGQEPTKSNSMKRFGYVVSQVSHGETTPDLATTQNNND